MDADAKKTALRAIPYGLYVLAAETVGNGAKRGLFGVGVHGRLLVGRGSTPSIAQPDEVSNASAPIRRGAAGAGLESRAPESSH